VTSKSFITDPANLAGSKIDASTADFGDTIAWNDHQIAFLMEHCAGKTVLDLGCVGHNPENVQSRFHIHRALAQRCASAAGLDLSEAGVQYLNSRGYNVVHGDAQSFDLGKRYDCVVAGDLVEHLEDFAGFFGSVKRHLVEGGSLIVSSPNPWYWRNVVKSVLALEVANNIEHTCWLCPRTMRQLAARHGMELREIRFGSRYLRDRLVPLPRGIKHTTWNARLVAA
jgi:2-polyprenyl-3-methyl-5-hydroxy-6-metoxy-1,4-benzoquinol methylase